MRIIFTVLGLVSCAQAITVKQDDFAQVAAEQLSPINVIDNSRGGAQGCCGGGGGGGGCGGGCGGCGGGCGGGCYGHDPCCQRSTLSLVHQVIMKEMELEMLKKEKAEKRKGADTANQMTEVDSAMAIMNQAQTDECEEN